MDSAQNNVRVLWSIVSVYPPGGGFGILVKASTQEGTCIHLIRNRLMCEEDV